MSRLRLDHALVRRGLVATRARAQDFIKQGWVLVAGRVEMKPGRMTGDDEAITLSEEAHGFVSRGALKLIAALDAFGLTPEGRAALDIGASTGGFTEVLIARGASRVYAVDVGSGQLHPRLRDDPRVLSLEDTDARRLTPCEITEPPGSLTADLSFISLTLVLPHVLALTAPDAWLVALVKPQFEVGRERIGKGGIVRDPDAQADAVDRVVACISAQSGWSVLGRMPSPVTGRDGNREWLIGALSKASRRLMPRG
ncbi:MAG: TlyA family RNA methyltransferase [Hyphomicrobiaceae bacterium]